MYEAATHNMYYLAVVCPPAIDEQIRTYKQWLLTHFGCKAALKSTAHITLVAPFWLEASKEPLLLHHLELLQTALLPVEIELHNFSHFGKKVLFVHVKENQTLARLQGAAEDHFAQHFPEIKRDQRPFHPHVTLATRDLTPGAFQQEWQRFSNEKYQAVFTADRVSLLKLSPGKWNIIAEKKF